MEEKHSNSRGITRREFFKKIGVAALGYRLWLPEIKFPQTTKEAIDALWDGRITPTWINISGFCAGQLQVREWNPRTADWDSELSPAFGWIHRSAEQPFGFRGLFFIHRGNLLEAEADMNRKITSGTKVKIYANWNHDKPVLVATIGNIANYGVERFNDSNDSLVKQIARSSRTIAIVSCDPPGCQSSECPRRIVYYARASVPK